MVTLIQANAAHARRIAALEDAHIIDGEADALTVGRSQQNIVIARADRNLDDAIAFVELHRDLAVAVDVLEIGQRIAPHAARLGGKHQFQRPPGCRVFGQRQDRGDPFPLLQRQQVDQRLADRLRCGGGQTPHLHPVDHATRRKEQDRRVGGGNEHLRDKVFLTRRCA